MQELYGHIVQVLNLFQSPSYAKGSCAMTLAVAFCPLCSCRLHQADLQGQAKLSLARGSQTGAFNCRLPDPVAQPNYVLPSWGESEVLNEVGQDRLHFQLGEFEPDTSTVSSEESQLVRIDSRDVGTRYRFRERS